MKTLVNESITGDPTANDTKISEILTSLLKESKPKKEKKVTPKKEIKKKLKKKVKTSKQEPVFSSDEEDL